ncbi:MAG: circadian clock KaiB family protein [Vicinamibacterales bacterium]
MSELANGQPAFCLTLFVAGNELNSRHAREVVEQAARELGGPCQLKVVDVFDDYQAAIREHILAVPALVIEGPTFRRVIVGSLADAGKLRIMLDLGTRGRP